MALGIAGLVAMIACEGPRDSIAAPAPTTTTTVVVKPSPDDRWVDLANDLAMLATGRSSSQAEIDRLASSQFSRAAFGAYTNELIASPDASKLAVRILHLEKGGQWARPTMGVLDHVDDHGETIFFLYKSCERRSAVKVKPWWSLSTPILVCPDSYRPEVFGDGKGASCTGFSLAPSNRDSTCGCGPNLMRCAPDLKALAQLQDAWGSEHTGTITYVASHDLPIQTIFSSNQSFRTSLAEFSYQRWRVENREIKSLEGVQTWTHWPEKGKWAPRYESVKGEHAGIFTNNYHEGASDSVRLKMVDMFNDMWCDVVQSINVSTDSLLELSFRGGPLNLRGTIDVNYLAARPGCTKCHARIDYAAQFFNGLQWAQMATHYDTRRQLDTTGPIYLQDMTDQRGEGKRNPASFVKLALAQPEFPTCIARRFSTHVFGKAGNDSELVGTLEQLVRAHASYRTLLKKTLDFYTDKRFTSVPNDPTKIPNGIVAMVDEQCSSCHDADDQYAPGLLAKHKADWCKAEGARCPDVALDMLIPLANRRMPKGGGMSSVLRVAMIKELARYVWTDPKQREVSVEFFTEQALGGKPIHRSDALVESIHSLAPPGGPPDKITPVATEDTFGLSLAAELGVAAARVCINQQDKAGCIRRALAPSRILK